MEVLEKPELQVLETGKSFKTLQITALAGMFMPTHHATMETVIIIHEGEALLKMPKSDHLLKKGASFIIAAGIEHSLEVKKDFKAIAIMAIASEIKFKE
jgi:quercetin dioxygenase-like cupin family protein